MTTTLGRLIAFAGVPARRVAASAVLGLLARNAGRVLTHRAILDQVWGPQQSLDTLRTHVTLLRRKLGTGPGVPQIETAPGVGYRLLAPDDA